MQSKKPENNTTESSQTMGNHQEPVAVVEITYGREPECYVTGNVDDLPEGVFKLYTAPQPVTTPDLCREVCVRAKLCYGFNKNLEEANAKYAEQTEQEPVAWAVYNVQYGGSRTLHWNDEHDENGDASKFKAVPLYTAPQPVNQEGIRFVWNGEGWIEADDYIWKTTNDWERRVLYTTPQSELNLNCKSVQKRLATSWGYVKAEQAECKECGAKQAQIDRLMLEYCPDEMTPEQMKEWGNNQRPAEQAEQEPVAWLENLTAPSVHAVTDLKYCSVAQHERGDHLKYVPVYAAPVRTKNLTDEELAKAAGFHELLPQELYIARAVIAADRKNK